jgi:hypothetical protein
MSDVQYSNRTDLQNVAAKVATGQTYGAAKQQMDAQRAVPMGKSPVDVASASRPTPGSVGSLTRPTERPTEPITAGAPFGAGPGPEVMSRPIMPEPGSSADLVERLRAIASLYPNPNILSLIAQLEAR